MDNFRLATVILFSILLAPTAADADCKGNHTGNHPHCTGGEPPPPTGCADKFPSFSYVVEKTKKSPAAIYLSSSNGCRTEKLIEVPDFRHPAVMHMTEDGTKGVLLWQVEPGDLVARITQRLDFTVDPDDGTLSFNEPKPVTLLPLPGETETVPAGDKLYYFSMDIWGDADHDSLYLATTRLHVINSGVGENIEEVWIFNLNNFADAREVYSTTQGATNWNCPDNVPFPQFVPTCYRARSLRFNPSGTRLYMHDDIVVGPQDQRWDSTYRINIDMGSGLPLSEWTLSAPEMVYASSDRSFPSGALALPDIDPYRAPSPEIIAMSYLDRSGKHTQAVTAMLDADRCAAKYLYYADGNYDAGLSLWVECITIDSLFPGNNSGRGDSWQTHEALLRSPIGKRGHSIFRSYIYGEMTSIEELLVEKATAADSGY